MKWQMKLYPDAFESIQSGRKNIEMRLYDEKRRKIQSGDEIEFINTQNGEALTASVIAIHVFANFEELYRNFSKTSIGYLPNEIANPQDMLRYYSKENIKKYGV